MCSPLICSFIRHFAKIDIPRKTPISHFQEMFFAILNGKWQRQTAISLYGEWHPYTLATAKTK